MSDNAVSNPLSEWSGHHTPERQREIRERFEAAHRVPEENWWINAVGCLLAGLDKSQSDLAACRERETKLRDVLDGIASVSPQWPTAEQALHPEETK